MSLAVSNAGALIGQRMGKYELVALLALGGTAEIYLARIGGVAGFEKYVVVKCLHDHLADDSEFVRMFLDEARITAQLDHSNIVQTIELGEKAGRYYIVMEYLAGMSLSLIARRAVERVPGGRLPVDLTLCVAAQACAGLHYAHQRMDASGAPLNIVHRDVSPQNLVVSFEGIVKLVDFGIAKAEMRDTHTRSGTVKGKFAYMSPEQCTAGHVDHRTDVFAMGVVVHELLTGRRLFKRASTYDTYRAIVEAPVPAPSTIQSDIDPALDELVMKALAYEREERYPSAEAFGEALTAALHRRGQAASAGLVAGFIEEYLGKEMGEHADRMRALIAGRKTVMEEQWDGPESSSNMGAGEGKDRTLEVDLEAQIIVEGDSGTLDDELEDDGGATRIELNPLMLEEELRSNADEGSQRRSSTRLPLPPEPETVLGAGRATTDDLAATPVDAAGQDELRSRSAAGAGDAGGMGADGRPGADGRASGSVPAPPHIPDSGASPRGRGSGSDDFAAPARTSPAGPMGLRGQRAGPPGHGDATAGAGEPGAPAGPGPDARYPSSPMEQQSGPYPVQTPPRGSYGPGMQHGGDAGARGLPVWFLAVLFVVSVGVGLGATLLIDGLFF